MARCMLCRKSLLRCKCHSAPAGTTTKTKAGNTVRNGIEWCGKCSCRVVAGRCTNVQCSTNAT